MDIEQTAIERLKFAARASETGLPQPHAEPPEFLTPEQHNAKAVTDKLTEIKDAIGRFHTPFAQAVCDILDEAIEDVLGLTGGG